jgi:hypothetical protein
MAERARKKMERKIELDFIQEKVPYLVPSRFSAPGPAYQHQDKTSNLENTSYETFTYTKNFVWFRFINFFSSIIIPLEMASCHLENLQICLIKSPINPTSSCNKVLLQSQKPLFQP